MFAAQSRHALERLSETLSPRLHEAGIGAVVHHLGYDGGDWEVAAKGFDYSRAALERRRRAGTEEMTRALSAYAPPREAGFTVLRQILEN